MPVCASCGKQIAVADQCPDCGTELYYSVGQIVCGAGDENACPCAIHLTDKYIILARMTKKEVLARRYSGSLGMIGALAVHGTTDSKQRKIGYYRYSDIAKGIFPFISTATKKKNAMKLITHDGKELILIVDQPGFWDSQWKALKKTVEIIRQRIPETEDGEKKNFGSNVCGNPLVTVDNFDSVLPTSPVAPNVTEAPVPPAPKAPEAPAAPPAPKAPEAPAAPPAPKAKVAAEPKAPRNHGESLCPDCGSILEDGVKFCERCGSRIAAPQPEPAPTVRDKVCTACGNALSPTSRFCDACGEKVSAEEKEEATEVICTSCGAQLTAKSKFCDQCGTPVPPPKPVQTEFDLLLTDCGSQPLSVIETICDETGLSLKEAKYIMENCPCAVLRHVSKEAAQRLAQCLEAVGAKTEIQ